MAKPFVCRIEVCIGCGGEADALCDEPHDPWDVYYRIKGEPLRHLARIETRQRTEDLSPAESRALTVWSEGIVRDWERQEKALTVDDITCSTPVCTACALDLGDDRHLCPHHAEAHHRRQARADADKAALIARGFGPLPADGWIRWRGKAHRLPYAESLTLACGRAVTPGWRSGGTAKRCTLCTPRSPRV